jgi:pyruvate, orthophosphate dikinase
MTEPLSIQGKAMVNVTHTTQDICRLDYLVGTIATAYKGNIKSLVVKDFCITNSGATTTVKGTVLAMPSGNYEASLNRSGVELSRAVLQKGYFEFTAESSRIAEAKDLQIDIIQSGRHIGTFLLKKERGGGIYLSAVELSEELAAFDLTRLTVPLRDKIGLLQKAEEIVAQLHSTKKDWAALSALLNGFSIDFYWNAPEGFVGAFDILAHFMLLAAERAEADEAEKTLSNYLDLLELPLQNYRDQKNLRSLAETWLLQLFRSSVGLASQAKRTAALLRELRERFSDIAISGVLSLLIESLKNKNASVMVLGIGSLNTLGHYVAREDGDLLSRFGEPGQNRQAQKLMEAGQQLGKGEEEKALDLIEALDFDLLDDEKAVTAFFDITEKGLTPASADAFIDAMAVYLSSAHRLSGRALASLRTMTPRIVEKLVAEGRPDVCAVLLRKMRNTEASLLDQIMLDPRFARPILNSGQDALIMQYVFDLQQVIVPSARVREISPDTWAELVSPLHLERLSKFMELLMMGDEHLEKVLIHVTANLAVSGALIPDDRLFQRRISAYLNSRAMEGQFLLNYLLLERLPVYFNDVGATSRLRDYSTEIDSWGNDAVIYFLRKQVHVNASSHNVRLLEQVITSWHRNDPSDLKEVVPPDIYRQVNPTLMARYASVMRRFFAFTRVQDTGGLHLDRLLSISDETIDAQLREGDDGDAEAREKVRLLCKLYKEVVRKYSLLQRDTAVGDVHARLRAALSVLRERKRIVLSPEKTEPQESLYFKRHIAFGIPSVLGTYHEAKFDALKDMLACSEDVPVLLESIISEVGKRGTIAKHADLQKWLVALSASWEVLKVYGLQNVLVDEYVEVLGHNMLHLSQIGDVLKMWQKELAWMVSELTRTFHEPLKEVIGKFTPDDLPEHLVNLDLTSPAFVDEATDIVMRDILSTVPGLVETDRLLAALVAALQTWVNYGGDSLREVGVTLPSRDFYDIHAIRLQDARSAAPDLGSKAKNLVYLREKGLTIPAGTVLPSRHTRNYDVVTSQKDFMAVLKKAVNAIEERTHEEFGGARRPLFLSVRSGSYLSMPGILSSILYCGMNEETVEAFIRTADNPGLGWDSYRKFIENYGMSVLGLGRDFFEQIEKEHQDSRPRRPGEAEDSLKGKVLVGLYLTRLGSRGLTIPSDVYEQLRLCVRAVYASWYDERAKQFRSVTGTSEEWGTSVTLMEMVSGNQGGAGASMFFTRDPYTLAQSISGETKENASGDDLASGRKSGRPLSRAQTAPGQSLEDRAPELYRLHQNTARAVEDAFKGLPQEVEATYTRDASGRYVLSVLQTRRMELGERFFKKFDEICKMESQVIGHGIGAGGGALSGVASFTASRDQIEMLKRETGLPVILLRRTANTNDVALMPFIKGIVTAAGGVTSHAAVLAQKFGISAVVSCGDMKIEADDQGRPTGIIGTVLIREGSSISIDGTNGLVFSGLCFRLKDSE